MCFTNSIFAKKKVATEDIVCYKGGFIDHHGDTDYFHPNFRDSYSYRKNYLQPRIKLRKKLKLNLEFIYFYQLLLLPRLNFEINEGYHSYINKKNRLSTCSVMEKFIIPKGTIYYSNKIEYVSEKIKWVGNEAEEIENIISEVAPL